MVTVLLGIIQRKPLLGVRPGAGKLTEPQQNLREHHVGPHDEPRIVEAPGQAEELLPQVVRRR